ncbi:MAG: hypothetical protein ABJ004_20625 [Cyclobacteriaceae bacterium]
MTTQSNIDEYGTLGPGDAYVTTRSEFDNMMAVTGGDLREIEKVLVFKEHSLSDDVVFAQIKRQHLGDVNIPSWNEVGASKEIWIPGGKTSNFGLLEGIVDLSDKNLPYDRL